MRWYVAMASSCALAALAVDADAYCLRYYNGDTHFAKWSVVPVTYYVSDNLADAKLLAAIDAAFTAWGGVSCSKLKFTKGGSFKPCLADPCDSGTVKIEHGTPYIYVFWVTTDLDKFKNPTAGGQPFSAYPYSTQDNAGSLTSGSVAVNAKDYQYAESAPPGCLGVFDLQAFMMPLIGNVVGLGASDFSGGVMDDKTPVAFCSDKKRTLTDDDKNALYYFYSDGTCPKPPVPNPTTGCAGGPGGPTTPGPEGARREVGPPIDLGQRDLPPPGQGDAGGNKDSGCCRVSHASTLSGVPAALLVLSLLLLRLRRRRS
jgi:hypothetical protein